MKHFVPWSEAEVEAARVLALQGMSSSMIAEAMAKQGFRVFTTKAVLGKLRRMAIDGVIPKRPVSPPVRHAPGPEAKPGGKRDKRARRAAARRAKPNGSSSYVAPEPKKRSVIAAMQKSALDALLSDYGYEPAPVIAGFPTIQVKRDVEDKRFVPVTLRRVDLGGAHA